MTSKAFEWYVRNPEKVKEYAGKHIAIIEEGIVAVGETAKEVYETAKKKYPKETPLLTYVPKGETLVL